jgi:cell division initiation protein
MRITPLDARKQEFRKAVRGYDCDEVRAFLSTLADEYETVLVDNKQLRERIMEQEDKIGEYKTMERTLRDTLMTAERLMQDTRESAGKESELIVRDAHLKARQVLEECRLRTEELRREMVNLRKEKENYLARFKSLAEAQIQFIETHRQDFKELDGRLVAMVDAVIDGVGGPAPSAGDQPQAAPRPAAAPAAPAWTNPVGGVDEDDAVQDTPQAAPAPAANEPDIWRDYQPLSRPETPAAAAAPAPAPEANPWAAEGWNDAPAAADEDQAQDAAETADEADEAIAVLHEDEPKPEPANIW